MGRHPHVVIVQKRPTPKKKVPAITFRGNLVQFKNGISYSPPVTENRRGVCKGFTRAARLRMLKMIATVDWSRAANSIFITLTYPDCRCQTTYKQRSVHRYLFMRKLEKHLDKQVSGLWRVEWEERKSGDNVGMLAPHFHLLLFDVPFVDWRKIRKWWGEIIDYKGYVKTWVKRCTGARGAGYYVAKYVGKTQDLSSLVNTAYLNNPGRSYGYHRLRHIPRCTASTIEHPNKDQIDHLRTVAASLVAGWDIPENESFTLFLELSIEHEKFVRGLEWTEPQGP